MRLQNLVVELISLTNLTCFLDRLFADGKYKAALFLYDDFSTQDNNLIAEIATVSFGKCSILTLDVSPDIVNQIEIVAPFFQQFNYIEVVMMDSRNWTTLIETLKYTYIFYFTLDVVFLMQMHPDQNRSMMLKQFENELYEELALLNCVVVFYRIPANGTTSAQEQSLEAYPLYSSSSFSVPPNGIAADNDSDAVINEFAIGSKNMRLVIQTMPSFVRPMSDTEFTMVDDADIFLSNFLSNNIENMATLSVFMRPDDLEYIEYNPSTQHNYMELYCRSTSKEWQWGK